VALVDAFLAQVPTQITWLDILLKNVARLSGARSEVRILHASFLLSTAFEKFFYFYMLATAIRGCYWKVNGLLQVFNFLFSKKASF